MENFTKPIDIFVLDRLTDTTHDIQAADFQIQLDPGEYLDRFAIVFAPNESLGLDDTILDEDIRIGYIKEDSTVKIRMTNAAQGLQHVELYNSLGQRVKSWQVSGTTAKC